MDMRIIVTIGEAREIVKGILYEFILTNTIGHKAHKVAQYS